MTEETKKCPCGSFAVVRTEVATFDRAMAANKGLCLSCYEDWLKLDQMERDRARRKRRKAAVGW